MIAALFRILVYGLALYGLFLLTLQLTGCCVCQECTRRAPVHNDGNCCLSLLFVVRDQAAIIEGLIRETLAIYHTSLPHFDLVIVDHASGDDTPEILRRLSQKHAFTFLECGRQEPQPLEIGLAACQGETVCYLDLTGKIDPRLVNRLVRRWLRGEKIGAYMEHCAATLVRMHPASSAQCS